MIDALFPGNSITLSVPGKTFLLGEYLALEGGPSIVLATAPRFELKASKSKDGHQKPPPFAQASPAGRFLARHTLAFNGIDLEFSDPHRGKGGLGASSAQFALLHQLVKGQPPERTIEGWRELLEEYRACAWSGEGSAPSGADVVAQLHGGITFWDGRELSARALEWSFPDLSFTLLRTGHKLATHEHLKRKQAAPHEALRAQVQAATTAFTTGNGHQLIEAVRDFATVMDKAGFVADATRTLLQDIENESGLALAAKGCGALGADIILVLHRRSHEALLGLWASGRGLEVCGTQKTLSGGFQVDQGK